VGVPRHAFTSAPIRAIDNAVSMPLGPMRAGRSAAWATSAGGHTAERQKAASALPPYARFPFEETPDQAAAITAVLGDLRAEQPTDRLVCGDVGFGKTELAMRAGFVAAIARKQVAILVPTTLLAQQHFENFKDRFADWPVRIELLSRFQKQTRAGPDHHGP
jgi:transcription-repair coupling factor (superfamily II helicase)